MRRHATRTAGSAASPAVGTGEAGTAHPLLGFQRAAGNRAVDRALHASAGWDGTDTHPATGGEPLALPLRAWFGGRFGRDLGGVRVHRGADAERAAASAGAAAYTVGSHVVFGRGQYAPETMAGRRLIGHELAHVVQQRPGAPAGGAAETPALERAANRASRAAAPGGGRVTVEGRAPAGMARVPISLSSTMELDTAPPEAIQDEIREIREWMHAHPFSSDTPVLEAALARLEGHLEWRDAGGGSWEAFAPAFNRVFAATLHAFAPATGRAPVGGALRDGASGADLTAAELQVLFTPVQRDKLAEFISTRRIPEGLFNADEKGTTTAQQRILISAHILARGFYRPGSFDQRVHARMCWHWAQIVHHYAGATPTGSTHGRGVMGSFDIYGGAVMGTGSQDTIFSTGKDERVFAADLPEEEQAGGVGPLHPETGHAKKAAEEAAPGARPAKIPVHRKPALEFERFDELQAGDWIYVYNANGSASGGHSEIFSHFTSGTLTSEVGGIPFRTAVVYSQPSSDSGGIRHTEKLGERFSDAENIRTITYVGRVSPDAAPATTAAELVPGAEAAEAMSKANREFIHAKEVKLRGRVDLAQLKGWFREQNTDFIDELDPHLTEEQEKDLREANDGDALEALVHLYQRLARLSVNAVILDRNMESHYAAKNAKHAEVLERVTAAQSAADTEIAGFNKELETVAGETTMRNQRRAALDVGTELKRLRDERAALSRKIQRTSNRAERDTLKTERAKKLVEIEELLVLRNARKEALAEVKAQLRTLATLKRRLEAKRGKAEKRKAAAARELPYGLVHPGKLKGQVEGRPTGRLKDLNPGPEWDKLLIPGAPGPAPAPRRRRRGR